MDEEFATPSPDAEPAAPKQRPTPGVRWRTLLILLIFLAGLFVYIPMQQRLILRLIAMNYDNEKGFPRAPEALPWGCYPYPWQGGQRAELELDLMGAETLANLHNATSVTHLAFNASEAARLVRTKPYSTTVASILRDDAQQDPGNAYYAYLLSSSMYNATVREMNYGSDPETGQIRFKRTIRDRKLLDRAMAELRAGTAKSRYHGYEYELLKIQSDAMSPAHNWEDYAIRLWRNNDIPMPGYGRIRGLVRALPWYAGLLADEGNKAEAITMLDCWKPITEQVTRDAPNLIGIMVVRSLLTTVTEQFPQAYAKAGRPDLGEQARQLALRIREPIQVMRTKRSAPRNVAFGRQLEREGGWLSYTFLPVAGDLPSYSDAQIAADRWLDDVNSEENKLTFFAPLLFALVCYFALTALRWRKWLPVDAPTGVALTVRQWLGILACMVLPLAVYAIYTRLTHWSGRGVGIMPNNLSDQVGVTILAMVVLLPLFRARLVARRQCLNAGISIPTTAEDQHFQALDDVMILVIWVLLFSAFLYNILFTNLFHYPVALLFPNWHLWSPPFQLFRMVFDLSVTVFLLLVFPVRWEKRRQQYTTYFHALARALVPVFTVSLALILGVCYPLLRAEEHRLIAQDTLVFFHNAPVTSVTPFEGKITESVRRQMLAALAEAQKSPALPQGN